jgi:CubicO group peptidase (beta-lactamase class C family)
MKLRSHLLFSIAAAALLTSAALVCHEAAAEVAQQKAAPPTKLPSEAVPLKDIRNLAIDEKKLRTHVLRPAHIEGIVSSKGLLEGKLEFKFPPDLLVAHLNVKAFCDQLHATLKDQVNGYVARLNKNGSPICTLQWNWAKRPSDGSLGWNTDRPMHIASVSKLITAIALTKLLDAKGISYDAAIIDYLPTYWQKGQNIDKITFRHLMTHRSGFSTGGSSSDYAFMKGKVAAGVMNVGQYDYENMNFGLGRILIAVINGNIAKDAHPQFPFIQNWPDIFWDVVTISAYKKYVEDNVFKPAGVSGPTLDHPGADALAYTFPVSGNGWNSGDLQSMSGGAAWHMSVNQLLNVMGTFRRKGTIMSNAKAQAMLDAGFGIDVVGMNTPAGKLYNKNGLWRDGSLRTEQSLAYFLPEGMELVVLTNSPVGSPAQFFRDVVTQVYADNVK